MLQDFYQHLPLNIDPIAFTIGSFAVRWYAISYIIAFLVVYLVLLWRVKNDDFENIAQIFNFQFSIFNKISNSQIFKKGSELKIQNTILDYLLLAFFCALVGGRVGYVLFYDPRYFFANPLAMVSPLDQAGKLVGIYGMSFHGAVIGIAIGSCFFLKKRKIEFLAWADFIIVAAAFGYFFGRIGNFLNGELYGRVTNVGFGMYFPQDAWQLRHPSQLYEALLEGILLPVILWKIQASGWKKKNEKGFLFGIYLFGYGLLRMFAEQFRQPDVQLGFFWNHFTMGQLLSFVMMLVGIFLMIPKNKK